MKVRFTPTGRGQFLAADPRAARQFRNRAERVLRCLEKNPESGRRLPEFPDLPFREVIVAPYRLFYRPDAKTVWIVAVWHGAQLPHEPNR